MKALHLVGLGLIIFGCIAVMLEAFGFSLLIYYGTPLGGIIGLISIAAGAIILGPSAYMTYIDNFTEGVGLTVSWLTTIMVIVVCTNVILRYVFGQGLLALQDLSWYLFGVLYMLGAAYTLKHDRHVRVDIVYANLSPKAKVWINLLGSVFFLMPLCLLGIFISMEFVTTSFTIRETTPDPGGLPARYLIKSMIPLGFLFLLLQGISMLYQSILQLRGVLPLPVEEGHA